MFLKVIGPKLGSRGHFFTHAHASHPLGFVRIIYAAPAIAGDTRRTPKSSFARWRPNVTTFVASLRFSQKTPRVCTFPKKWLDDVVIEQQMIVSQMTFCTYEEDTIDYGSEISPESRAINA